MDGVNLLIVLAKPGIRDRRVKKHLKRWIREDPELSQLGRASAERLEAVLQGR